jgi:holo-[acyl-carrier protein] synthase
VTTVGVGVDIVDVPRFALALERHPALLTRLFTDQERLDTKSRPDRLAARFAAKEAVLKTLDSGIGAAPWRTIEIRRGASGAPSVHLHGVAVELALSKGVEELHVSLTHTPLTAAAFVVGSATSKPDRAS